MTTAEVAARLGLNTRTVARMARDGRLPPALKFPGIRGPYMFDPVVVEMYGRQLARKEAAA
jgi:excisionase family DNA binding protein